MPGGDRTGPRGEGPATGWGFGGCAPQGGGRRFGGGGWGKGWGRGRGPGRGWWKRVQGFFGPERVDEEKKEK